MTRARVLALFAVWAACLGAGARIGDGITTVVLTLLAMVITVVVALIPVRQR